MSNDKKKEEKPKLTEELIQKIVEKKHPQKGFKFVTGKDGVSVVEEPIE